MTLQREVENLLAVIATPSTVFKEINQSPRWRMAFILVAVSSVMVGWFMIPAIEEPLRKIYARSFGEGAAGTAVASLMHQLMLISTAVEAIFKIIRWLVVASTIYFVVKYFTGNDDHLFKRLFAVVAYSEVVFILMGILNLLVIYLRGFDRIATSADITTVNKGLEFFFSPGSNTELRMLLSNVNIFSLWYIGMLSIGVSVATGVARLVSLGFVVLAWAVWLVLCMAQPPMEKLIMGMISSYA